MCARMGTYLLRVLALSAQLCPNLDYTGADGADEPAVSYHSNFCKGIGWIPCLLSSSMMISRTWLATVLASPALPDAVTKPPVEQSRPSQWQARVTAQWGMVLSVMHEVSTARGGKRAGSLGHYVV